MRILCTGSAGMLGSWLCDKLIEKGHQVIGIDNLSGGLKENINDKVEQWYDDLRDEKAVNKILDYYYNNGKVDVLFHLAADATEGRSQFTPRFCIDNNLIAYINLAKAAIRTKIPYWCIYSSMSIYGNQSTPFDESMPRNPVDVYAHMKSSIEGITECFSDVYDFKYTLVRPHNCYDDQTEILTDGGFKVFRDLKEEDLIATLNPCSKALEYHKAEARQKIPYNGDMYHFEGATHDIMVTPDHKMYVSRNVERGCAFEFIAANKLVDAPAAYDYELYRSCKSWTGEDRPFYTVKETKDKLGRAMTNDHQNGYEKIIPMEIWCRFLGWYISEGSRFIDGGHYVISISQCPTVNPDNRIEIIETIKKMGFHPNVNEKTKDIRIFSKQLYKELDNLGIGKSEEKFIPRNIKNLDVKYLKHLFDSLMKGDGNKKMLRYSTVSKKLADDFVELVLKLGISSKVSKEYYNTEGVPNEQAARLRCIYRIFMSEERDTPQIGKTISKEVMYKIVAYSGYVYDVTVPNHIIFVRRNGKACWSSNCIGPRQYMPDAARNVLAIWVNCLLRDKPFFIYGDGTHQRAWSYVGDIIDACVKCLEVDVHGQIINLGAKNPNTLNELSQMVREEFESVTGKKTPDPIHLPDRPREVPVAYSTVQKSIDLLGYKETKTLREAVREFIEWAYKKYPYGVQPKYSVPLELVNEKTPRTWVDQLI